MPRRDDLRTILIIGSGPIVIGQACEFDYSGVQACKALRQEGYRVVLINSNPATIMTDPAMADRTYVEPITPEAVKKILLKERELGTPVDAVLPTLGGQTALNTACKLWDDGVFQELGVEMIGADRAVIHRAEDREEFKKVCERLGISTGVAKTVSTMEDALEFLKEIGLPAIIRPAFTLGGSGGGIAYNLDEFKDIITRGLDASMIRQVQIDKSLLGWKEYELEVVRDKKDNCVIVCGIENFDPMGVHTGDSITVAPILTLTDKEYQTLRDAAIAIMREVGVECGGSNVQFAIDPDPKDGQFHFMAVEMNPRVSRSSALASKATGFPIAKIAAKLAVGYTLDELRNDITGTTSACFEPTIDYIVVKMPRWTFEKFPEADETLTTQMKSVGEAMAIGRTFKEALQKVIRSMEVKRFGLGLDRNDKWLAAMRAVEHQQLILDFSPGALPGTGNVSDTGLRTADGQAIEWPIALDKLTRKLAVPSQGRLYFIRYAMKMGWDVDRIAGLTKIDPFFLDQIRQLVEFEDVLCSYPTLEAIPAEVLFEAKQLGYSDPQLANLFLGNITTDAILKVREHRKSLGIEPVYKCVDTCAAEFEAITPYYYSTYEAGFEVIGAGGTGHKALGTRSESTPLDQPGASPRLPSAQCPVPPADDEIRITDTPKVVIIGGGPNRIGQGIEFDYCCVHAALTARDMGFESVMINSNPETVSTDYDTSDLLFFEPLTLEDVLNIVERLEGAPSASSGGRLNDSTNPELALRAPLVHGLIVQFGGQTPLNLARGLVKAGCPILGTSLDSIDLAEDRDRFDALLTRLNLKRPESGIARSLAEAVAVATRIGYPVLVRPSYVLGGRGMEICSDEKTLRDYITNALEASDFEGAPVLIDKFLDGATEVDVDVVADFEPSGEDRSGKVAEWQSGKVKNTTPQPRRATTDQPGDSAPRTLPLSHFATLPLPSPALRAVICGVMQHIEHAGIHSGDSSCCVPPWSLPTKVEREIREIARTLAAELKVCGLMNVQLAVKDDEVYILEVNPRASRTAPFVAKAKNIPWPAVAARAMLGESLDAQNIREVRDTGSYAVKAPVFPHKKFPGVDFVLGPEMRSTGEVMGIDVSMPVAYLKALLGAGIKLPRDGGVFISVREADKPAIADVARSLMAMGFKVYTTDGTAAALKRHGLRPNILPKIGAGIRPNVLDLMSDGSINLIINTPTRTGWQTDEGRIRATAIRSGIPMLTTVTAAAAAVRAIEALRAGDWDVAALQDYAQASPEPERVGQV